MNRRDFIQRSCTLCVALSAGLLSAGSLVSCASYPAYETVMTDKKVIVPLSLFAKKKIQIISVKDFEYNIALEEEKNGSYNALLLRCTHASTPLNFTGKDFVCPLHGSEFDENGRVLEGPATRPLKKLATEVSSKNVIIYLA
jgi:Rieske Fe-S protein